MDILTLSDLNIKIKVVEHYEVPKTNYMLDFNSNQEVIIRFFEKGREVSEDDVIIGTIVADNFEGFFKEVRRYFPKNTKFSISKDYALILLALYNGGEPEDYEEEY